MLFNEIVFGPVQSRRLGVSLGINLLPVDCKYCNFDCIYCECGRNVEQTVMKLPTRQDVCNALEHKLTAMQQAGKLPDAITFAGNGEPTVHHAFAEIIYFTVSLRNRLAPQSKITVLSNASMLHKIEVVEALKLIDMPIMKFDSAIDDTIALLNQPSKSVTAFQLIDQMQLLENQCIIQTMFLKGTYLDQTIDNTTPTELNAWKRAILAIRPKKVTIYSIARVTPIDTLEKVSGDTLKKIAANIEKHGIPVQVSE